MSTENETAESAKAEQQKSSNQNSNAERRRSQSQSRRRKVTVDDVIAFFAPCGRCGFFLSGYRAAFGREALASVVEKAKGGWLTFAWNYELQELVLKSFGSRIEANDYHFDGCCPECRRAFTYHASRSDRHPDHLRIEIKPRRRQ